MNLDSIYKNYTFKNILKAWFPVMQKFFSSQESFCGVLNRYRAPEVGKAMIYCAYKRNCKLLQDYLATVQSKTNRE